MDWINQSEDIQGTNDDDLYHRCRADLSSVHFYVGDSTSQRVFDVGLHFAEFPYMSSSGEVVFDVVIEGQVVLADFNIHQLVGYYAARVETFRTTVVDGILDIEFAGEDTLLSAVRISGVAPPATVTPTPTQTLTPTPVPTPTSTPAVSIYLPLALK